MNVLLTGASGFVGSALIERLLADGRHRIFTAGRRPVCVPGLAGSHVVGDLGPDTDWKPALRGIDVIVHLAARVHVMRDTAMDPLAEFRRANAQGTQNLAEQAAAAGVRRLIYVSSIKVNGEHNIDGRPFQADDEPRPADPYGISKHEAEVGLRRLAAGGGIETVIVRPPLVYGPGVKANFAALMRAVANGVPLPLGAIHNRRSLVAVDNLVDLLETSIAHPAAAGQTFLVSDDEEVSTTDLIRRMGRALGRPARLLPIPATMLRACAALLGKAAAAERLCGSLRVDIAKTRSILAWTPPIGLDEGLRRAVLPVRPPARPETAS